MKYKKTVVSFIDVLGTKERKDFDSKYTVHRTFHESMKDVRERDRVEAGYYRTGFNFSDCAYLFHGLRDGADESTATEDLIIQVALFNTSISVIKLLNLGHLVRGGISYDDAYYDELSFFGPAVEEAYTLESKCAVTPRIVLSPALGERAKTFSDKAHAECFSEENPLFKRISLPKMNCMPELVKKHNESYYLNTLYILEMEGTLQMNQETYTHQDTINAIIKSVEDQLPLYPWESKERPKLEWMREYAKASKPRYGTEHTGIAVLRDRK